MKVKYIYNSGFLIETKSAIILIDYYNGDFKEIDNLLNESNKRRYILCSHSHSDHYDTKIYDFTNSKDFFYILSEEILADTVPCDKENVHFLLKGEGYSDDIIEITAYGSTDVGISFYITVDKCQIFHAGDLNNWHWEEEVNQEEANGYEKAFLSELEDINANINALDVLFFPIDNRLGKDYFRGAKQFVEKIKPKYFIPMHFREEIKAGNGFKEEALKQGIIHCDIKNKGEEIELDF